MIKDNKNLSIYLSEEDNYTISVNEDIGLVIKRNDVGYSVDVYSAGYEKLLTALTIWDEDIESDEEGDIR